MHFRAKPHLGYTWENYNISSEPDYGVYSDRSRGGVNNAYFLVIEDKRPNGLLVNAEHQLAGEMFIAACNRADIKLANQETYGIITRGETIEDSYDFTNTHYSGPFPDDASNSDKEVGGYLSTLSQEELRKIFKTDGAVSIYPN
ncbi:hypothetical protein CONCODRAFT_8005 [Conidiobolus coronatus NRRL 28638]|uniref:Uncharacterized protein n=1 Tax=Conidiobolus coronatus (strain ATCC 28846 / CBS 209.66 / NRRL 28638) TaxID=796925 RepID=A0A137P3J1_CONC2|nr:hypothetical protein CONCODRAFT_8005 [Conidiobolus coronatus NRRL 28638]|eukprot:KXN69585.1 hypothetical protein CONCODRAFT_8005 [Conidiobolus coronatus NRRL 28638]